MAEDAENDANGSARRRPKVPKPKRESALIEGEAKEIFAGDEPARSAAYLAATEPAAPPPSEIVVEPPASIEPESNAAVAPYVAAEPGPPGANRDALDPSAIEAPSPNIPSEVERAGADPHAVELAAIEPPVGESPPPVPSDVTSEPERAGVEPAAAELAAEEPPVAEPPPPPPPYVAPPPPPPSARSGPNGLGYGAIGGIIGAAAALLVAWSFDPRASAIDAIDIQLHALEAADASDAEADKNLASRVAALESTRPAGAKEPDLAALEKRLADLESTIPKPEALTAAQNDARDAKETATKALALASGASAASAGAADRQPDPRVAALLASQQAIDARLTKDETSLDDRFAKLDAGLGDRLGKAIGDVTARIRKLEAVVFAPKVETRVPPAETAEDAQKKSRAATRAIAATALLERLKAGDSYSVEFAALSHSDADAAALAALKPFSESGAPTDAALARAFRDVEPAVLAAGKPPRAEGAVGRILDQMTQLVQVRRVGETPGEAPDAVVTQIEGALSRGDIAGALAAYQKLPDASRAAAADWAKSAGDRVKADAAARDLRNASIAGLDGTKN